MEGRNFNNEQYGHVFKHEPERALKTAFTLGKSDFSFNKRNPENKQFNPYPEHSAEYNAYEAAYVNQELFNG